jgi:predicted DNA-binding transcriptional regulator AlpA
MKQIMNRREVLEATDLCYTSIYNKMKRGDFPSSKQLSAKRVGWIRQEVYDWLDRLQSVYTPVVQS